MADPTVTPEMQGYQALAAEMFAQFAPLVWGESLTWTKAQRAIGVGASASVESFTVRCSLTPLASLPFREIERLRQMPEFQDGDAVMGVHQDDEWPPLGSTCDHPRFGRAELIAIGPASLVTGLRQGVVRWTK